MSTLHGIAEVGVHQHCPGGPGPAAAGPCLPRQTGTGTRGAPAGAVPRCSSRAQLAVAAHAPCVRCTQLACHPSASTTLPQCEHRPLGAVKLRMSTGPCICACSRRIASQKALRLRGASSCPAPPACKPLQRCSAAKPGHSAAHITLCQGLLEAQTRTLTHQSRAASEVRLKCAQML
jgi:hypothetical protein